jgi:hypothetical protein
VGKRGGRTKGRKEGLKKRRKGSKEREGTTRTHLLNIPNALNFLINVPISGCSSQTYNAGPVAKPNWNSAPSCLPSVDAGEEQFNISSTSCINKQRRITSPKKDGMDKEGREGRTRRETYLKCDTEASTPCVAMSRQMSPTQPPSGTTVMELGDVGWG